MLNAIEKIFGVKKVNASSTQQPQLFEVPFASQDKSPEKDAEKSSLPESINIEQLLQRKKTSVFKKNLEKLKYMPNPNKKPKLEKEAWSITEVCQKLQRYQNYYNQQFLEILELEKREKEIQGAGII